MIVLFHATLLAMLAVVTDAVKAEWNCSRAEVPPLHTFTPPDCMRKWIDEETFWEKPHMKSLWDKFTVSENVTTFYVATHDPAMSFFQHAIKSIYPFVSMKLWFHYRYQSEKRLVFIIHEGKKQMFTNYHDEWIDEFLLSVKPIVGHPAAHPVFCIRRGSRNGNNTMNLEHFFSTEMFQYRRTPEHMLKSKLLLHPSDALRISAVVLGNDPCRLSKISRRDYMLRPPMLKIIDRTKDRNFSNIATVMDKIDYMNPERVTFENMSFIEQARFLSDVDIVIMAHGAAEANGIFLKPCSVVIEYFPYGVCYDFFSNLYQSMDVIQAPLYDTNPPVFDEECMQRFKKYKYEYKMTAEQDMCRRFRAADYFTRQCRVRLPIAIDVSLLEATLYRVQGQRLNCIESHPLFVN